MDEFLKNSWTKLVEQNSSLDMNVETIKYEIGYQLIDENDVT